MIVGVPKERKNKEYRVALTPAGAGELCASGHSVLVEKDAGHAIGLSDEKYSRAGAEICSGAAEVFARGEMIVKVKEPLEEECAMLRAGQLLFTYLHLAPDNKLTGLLLKSGVSAIAYETVRNEKGELPLLVPMSMVAGRLSAQEGAACLKMAAGGSGVLMGGVPGVAPAKVCVIGGGIVGLNAARIAAGMGAEVSILDNSPARLQELDELFANQFTLIFSSRESISAQLQSADLVIGAVLIPGAAAPKLVSKEMLSLMKPGSVLVDVAIDQGGCFESSRPTTHEHPTYILDGIVHYCVTNMPGAVAQTSSHALSHATLPYIKKLADKGLSALKEDEGLRTGLNVYRGKITCEGVATAQGLDWLEPLEALGSI